MKKKAPAKQRGTGRQASRGNSQPKRKLLAVNLKKLPKESDPSIRLLWVDTMELVVRHDVPVATLRFYSSLGDKLVETCRIQTSVPHLKAMADVINRNLQEIALPRAAES